MELARGVLQREAMKRDVAIQGKAVWEKRFVAIDLKRKFPSLGTKEDDELFQDKERVPKKVKPTDVAYVDRHHSSLVWPSDRISSRIPIKLRTGRDSGDFGSPVVTEPMMRPAVRASMIQSQVEEELAKRKDHRWEDAVDVRVVSVLFISYTNVMFAESIPATPDPVWLTSFQVHRYLSNILVVLFLRALAGS